MQAECPKCNFNIEIYEKSKRISIYLYNRGLSLMNDDAILDAIKSLEKSLTFYKSNIIARNLLGILYYQIGEVGEALKHWVISANIKKSDNPAEKYIEEMKNEKIILERKNEAVKIYNEALQYIKQRNEDIAIIKLNKAISLSPNLLKAYMLLALCYYNDEETREKGLTFLERARQIDKNSSIMVYYSKMTKVTDEKVKAVPVKDKTYKNVKVASSKEINPFWKYACVFSAAVLVTLGAMYYTGGFNAIASNNSQLKTQLKQREREILALSEESNLYKSELNVYKDAEKRIEEEANFLQAENLYNSGNIKESANMLKNIDIDYLSDELKVRYESLQPVAMREAGSAYFAEGKAFFDSQKNIESISSLELAISFGPDETYTNEAYYTLGRVYQRQGNTALALEMYNTVIEKYPGTHISDLAEYWKERINE